MAIARTHSVSMLGMQGAIVEIEADVSSNLPNIVLIGLPDAALNESKDRVRDDVLAHHGFRVVRVTNAEVMGNMEGVLGAILMALNGVSDRWDRPHPNPSPEGEGLSL